MAYYFRVFCTTGEPPALAEVLRWVADRGVRLRTEPTGITAWGSEPVKLVYEDGRAPFLAEVDLNNGPDSLAAQEIGEFLDLVREIKKYPRKRERVADQLEHTRFIVACRIPVDDFTDAGFHAIDVFMAYFLVHHGGMVQADGQGFYEDGKITLELAA
ncbi:MAG TPA: hypothetical protein PLZ36_00700 [Armatimonadota bacterium]|nr:hypothetical protein [Armatimonadota bacterium]HOS44045.1 hypothetical protein [Armatimonadota bacterium]